MATESAKAAVGTARQQVVLVDHDLEASKVLVAPLRGEFDFHLTISASDALAFLERHAVAAIVAGQKLFSATGLEVLIEARKRSPRTTRILLADASDRRAVEQSSEHAGLFQILKRPCTAQQLKEALQVAAWSSNVQSEDSGEVEHVVLETPGERPPSSDLAGVPVTVLTTDADLYEAIRSAVDGRHDAFLATRLEDAAEFAATGRCPVLITDQALAQPALERIARHLHTHESALVTIAVGTREQGNALIGLLSTGVIHRFLLKPVTPGLARLAIDSAARQHLSIKAHPRTDPLPQRPAPRTDPHPKATTATPAIHPDAASDGPFAQQMPRTDESAPLRDEGTSPDAPEESRFELGATTLGRPAVSSTRDFGATIDWRRFMPAVLIGAAAVTAVAAGIFWWLQQRAPEVDPRLAAIATKLSAAEDALEAGRLVEPADQSAAHFYAEVLALDPDNARAQAGLDGIATWFIEQAEGLMVTGRLEEAAAALENVRRARPDHRRLRFLDTQLRKEQQDRLVLQARESTTAGDLRQAQELLKEAAKVVPSESTAVDAAQAAIDARERLQVVGRSLDTARQRLAQGQLVSPENDSAKFHLRAAQRADPASVAVQQGLRDLGARVVAAADQAIERNQLDTARTWLLEAQDLGVPPADLEALRRRFDTAQQNRAKNDLLQLVLRRTEENRLLEPAQDSAKLYLQRLAQADPGFPGLQRGIAALGERLVANARLAISQRQFDLAANLLEEARGIGFIGPELGAADAALRTARTPVSVAPRIPQPVAPKRVTYVAPEYPRQALQDGVEGWVDVSFAVNAAGDVVDARVDRASRRNVFDRSALTAVRQWKFEAREVDNPDFTQRVTMRVEFRLKE